MQQYKVVIISYEYNSTIVLYKESFKDMYKLTWSDESWIKSFNSIGCHHNLNNNNQ